MGRRSDFAIPLLVLAAGLAASLLIGLFISDEIARDHRETVSQTEQRLLGATQALTEHVDSNVSAIDIATLYLRDLWENDRPRFAAVATEIRNTAIPKLILQVTVIDRDGWLIISTIGSSEEKVFLGDREHFLAQRDSATDAIFISKPIVGRLSKEVMIQISRKMVDKDGRFDGVLVIAIRPDDLIRIYDHLELGAEGSIGLIGADDRVMRVRQSHIVTETHPLSDTLPADRVYFRRDAPPQGVFHTPSGGVDQRPRIIAYRRLEHYPLIVYVSETDLDISARTAAHDHQLIVGGGLGGAGLLSFALVIAGFLFRQFRNQTALTAAEQALRQLNQDLEARVTAELAKNREKDHLLIQQSRLAAMGEMVHNIAHQWRQPLNALGLLISNLHDDVIDGISTADSLDQDVATARRLIEKMSTTIDDFRDFFRPDREAATFDIAEAVRDAVAIIDASMRNNRITLTSDLPENILASGYANQYAQAALNLLVNAKEALVARQIADGRIALTLRKAGGRAVLTIEDNAGGIAGEILPKIFDPYFTTKEQGSGIGLYMVKMIIERGMGGKVDVVVTASGTRFSLSVPLEEG